MSSAEETAQWFVDVWADEVRGRVRDVREDRKRFDDLDHAYERGEWTITERDLLTRGQQLWVAQHHLVWATNQLEQWVRRLARERGKPEAEPDPVLTALRDALEHLDDAVLDEDIASAGPGKGNRALRRLPGSQLYIGTFGSHRMFGLVDPEDIERRALAIVTTADRLEQQAEDYVHDLMARGEWPPGDGDVDE
ncbi:MULTISPECIES: hypothetical protein [unclassified Modestobacter]|uniref:hypothetical protein n=1 Tax=unclassified Modestobacter TaxID=2643866 RepID=UPI0022AB2E9F|nr:MULTISPECIES: hypothetical protein [unclassified Modestobacter]MCZ2826027.1 hypothetical protein [Modestobacter sp. VKM Ac-2981]MCZ2852908.1 hypothetical protein [Modestobacter sp. VKM Ac-2982]